MEWSTGDLIWFDPGLGHPLPGEIQEVHRAAQIIIVQAVINGKVTITILVLNLITYTPRD
jgi:myosin XV